MKNKSLIAIAVSSLLSVSLAYAAPAETTIPGDDAGLASSAQTPSMDSLGNSAGNNVLAEADPSAIATAKSDTVATTQSDNMPSSQMEASNNNDDISADTATGDDDF